MGKVSYCEQEVAIISGSIKDNILFDREYDEEKYRNVIRVCALEDIFNELPEKDNTSVG